ncbi:transcriptional repressor [Oceaniovalibus sp. ACAM 378]|uniref:transcriptional repressor n=1 Tax=Oceaniovalibus sp. ACAM 378 TaxID=2599923 RepID=UPI0011D5698C|nr:transcriptional repressor [Oceaniovalibus sp. ACAM 378]TYB90078.1 transcriptional repressor [Oceaniovalibus sp. ACAM 378]
MRPIAFERHDHARCIDTAVARAARHCAEKGVQFTPVRRRVLEILLEEHRAFGAYDILDRLRAEGRGAQPPVAYRALEFLVRHGFAHRIERLSAFAACAFPGSDHAPAFLICRDCRAVAEAEQGPGRSLDAAAAKNGFTIEQTVVEAEGLCPNCVGAA